MKRKTVINRVWQAKGLMLGREVVLLLLSAGGLTLVAQHDQEQGNVVSVLLALHLASWSYALGIAGLVLLPVLTLIEWFRVKRAAISRYFPAEPGLEKPGMEGTQFLEQGVPPVVLNRASRQSDDRMKATSSSKVA
jgi:hypothetical protein